MIANSEIPLTTWSERKARCKPDIGLINQLERSLHRVGLTFYSKEKIKRAIRPAEMDIVKWL